jgi:hypothetical protein
MTYTTTKDSDLQLILKVRQLPIKAAEEVSFSIVSQGICRRNAFEGI